MPGNEIKKSTAAKIKQETGGKERRNCGTTFGFCELLVSPFRLRLDCTQGRLFDESPIESSWPVDERVDFHRISFRTLNIYRHFPSIIDLQYFVLT